MSKSDDNSFDLASLLADEAPVPTLMLRVGPDLQDNFEIKALELEAQRDKLVEFLLAIPNLEQGLSWEMLRPYTRQNGWHAKLAIALGQHLGLWEMHPPVDIPGMWNPRLHPMIKAGSVKRPASVKIGSPRRAGVPKPSRGDLEWKDRECDICQKQRAPQVAAALDPDYRQCEVCGDSVRLETAKTAGKQPGARVDFTHQPRPELPEEFDPSMFDTPETDEAPGEVPVHISDYLKQFK